MLYNQTYNLDQVAFAAEGLKDAQQTVILMALPKKNLDLYRFHQSLDSHKTAFHSTDDCNEGCQQRAERNDENCQARRYRCK